MEEEWWSAGSSEEVPSEDPKPVFIGGPQQVSNVLSGDVSQEAEEGQAGVWGQMGQEESSRLSPAAWFAIGLVVVPVLFVFSSILAEIGFSSDWNEVYSDSPVQVDDVAFGGEDLEVHSFYMEPDFENGYRDEGYWDMVIEGWEQDYWWNCRITGDGGDVHQGTITDDSWVLWFEPEGGNREYGCPYVRVEGDSVYVATQPGSTPDYVGYWGEGSGSQGVGLLSIAPCLVMPAAMLGGTVWGFVTDRKSFSYGILSWAALLLLGFLLFMLAWFGAFF